MLAEEVMAALQLGQSQFQAVHLLRNTPENPQSRKLHLSAFYTVTQLENDKEMDR